MGSTTDDPPAEGSASSPVLVTEERHPSSSQARRYLSSPVGASVSVGVGGHTELLPPHDADVRDAEDAHHLSVPRAPAAVVGTCDDAPDARSPNDEVRARPSDDADCRMEPPSVAAVTLGDAIPVGVAHAVTAHEERQANDDGHRDRRHSSAVQAVLVQAGGSDDGLPSSTAAACQPRYAGHQQRLSPGRPVVGEVHGNGPAVQSPAIALESREERSDHGAGADDHYPRVASDWYKTMRKRSRKSTLPRYVPPGSRCFDDGHVGVLVNTSVRAAGADGVRRGPLTTYGGQESACPDRGGNPAIAPAVALVARPQSDTTSDDDDIAPVHVGDGAESARPSVLDDDANSDARGGTRLFLDTRDVHHSATAPLSESTSQLGGARDRYGLSLVSVTPDCMWPGAVPIEVQTEFSTPVPLTAGPELSAGAAGPHPIVAALPRPFTPQLGSSSMLQDESFPGTAPMVMFDQPPAVLLKSEPAAYSSPAVTSEPMMPTSPVVNPASLPPAPLEVKLESPWPLPRAVKLEHPLTSRDSGHPAQCASEGASSARVSAVRRGRFEASKRPFLQLARTRSLSALGRGTASVSVSPGVRGGATGDDVTARVLRAAYGQPSGSAGPSSSAVHAGVVAGGTVGLRDTNTELVQARRHEVGAHAPEREFTHTGGRSVSGGAHDAPKR